MAILFVSHASKDDAFTTTLESWLHSNGFTDTFVDHSAIAGGDSWRNALQAAAGTCRVVLCLVTENWLNSTQCMAEFDASFYMGKRVVPLFLFPPSQKLEPEASKRLDAVRQHYQGLDLAKCLTADGLNLGADTLVADRLMASLRAAGASRRVGLDPHAFDVDRTLRPTPFPGLTSFSDEDADAALFYGRSREIEQALEEIRSMRAKRDRRPFVILGASGAGKSSLLKAGILPRLRRESPAWLPLRAFRPGADPLLNFAEALSHSLRDYGKAEAQGVIRDRLFAAWSDAERVDGELSPAGRKTLGAELDVHGRMLLEAAGRSGSSLLISVDQAEEIAQAGNTGGEMLADYLRAATEASSDWHLALTIRTDSFQELQGHSHFRGLEAHPFDLRALPVFRFDTVVEEPAKRYGVTVEHSLIDALMDDAPKDDALPLLAFALQRLWRQYAASGTLVKDNYVRLGGLRGLIQHAAERALGGLSPEDDTTLPIVQAKRRVDLAAATFVPALAQINELGATTRRIAPWKDFTDEQKDLLWDFDRWRLVVRKGDATGGTIEVAHEALFREWTRFATWLEPERARLEALRSLQSDALTWNRSGQDPAYLNHREKRFTEANDLLQIESYKSRLEAVELDYLDACRIAERHAIARARRNRIFMTSLTLCVFAVFVGWMNQSYLFERYNWFMKMRPYMLTHVRPFVISPEAERALPPLGNFRDCPVDCPIMIKIPPGDFMMGSPPTDAYRYPNESPRHLVHLNHNFAIGRFDVTVAEWNACVAVGGCRKTPDTDYFGGDNRPVENVSWYDTQDYVNWLSKMTGKPYRLLSEAEWEYSARARSTTIFYWGDKPGVNNADCLGCGSKWDSSEASPVGSFAANAFGLYDMAGDVWQWVQDCVPGHGDGNYNDARVDGAVSDQQNCGRHYARGGSFVREPRNMRPAARYPLSTEARAIYQGFRVGLTLPP